MDRGRDRKIKGLLRGVKGVTNDGYGYDSTCAQLVCPSAIIADVIVNLWRKCPSRNQDAAAGTLDSVAI